MVTTDELAELRKAYGPVETPKCRLCGELMELSAEGGGRVSYGCTANGDFLGPGSEDKAEHNRRFDHYSKSHITLYHSNDSRVIRVLDALDAAQSRATAAEERERALRAVVEWYADDENYEHEVPGEAEWFSEEHGAWIADGGRRARAALAALDGSEES